MREAIFCLVVSVFLPFINRAQGPAEVPVFEISQQASMIGFEVDASVTIQGTFDKWNASLTFTSPDPTTGILNVKIQGDSVNTGSGMKDGKLKSEKFFDVEQDPWITFLSKKIVQTGPDTFDVLGDFTIRGVTRSETLKLTVPGKGTSEGEIRGTMAFDRKQYGMNSGIPFIRIADRVEVSVKLKVKRLSGPPLSLQQ